jgi:hypothetical protein
VPAAALNGVELLNAAADFLDGPAPAHRAHHAEFVHVRGGAHLAPEKIGGVVMVALFVLATILICLAGECWIEPARSVR